MIRSCTCKQCGCVFDGGPNALYCPKCRIDRKNAAQREYYRANRNKVAEWRRNYYQAHRDDEIAYQRRHSRQYYLNNRDKILAATKRRYREKKRLDDSEINKRYNK